MKNGLYIHKDNSFNNRGEYIIRLKETDKAYIFELIKNNMRFSPAHLDMMFSKSNRARVNKDKSPHAMNIGEDYFIIYPYRAGIPYLFDMVNDNEKQ